MWGRVCHNGVGRHTFGDNTLIISNCIATTLTDRGVGTPNLMQCMHHTPGGSDIRYPIVSHSDFNNQWFTPYTNAAEINPHQIKHTSSSSWIQDHNRPLFLPNCMAAIGACKKPIITEAVASLTSTNIPYEDLTKLNSSAYMLQSTTDQTLGHMDQIHTGANFITMLVTRAIANFSKNHTLLMCRI